MASVACGVALGGGAAIAEVTDDDSPWPSERVLGMCSGLALSLYSLYLFKGFLEGAMKLWLRLARSVLPTLLRPL